MRFPPPLLAALSALAALPTLAGHHEKADCRAVVDVFPGTTLARLADVYFGDVDYRYAILLATNARAGDGFDFVQNPNDLGGIKTLCIPQFAEAEIEKNRFRVYEEAVRDMALALPSEVSTDLDPLDVSKPVTVVSWVRADQALGRPGHPGWVARLGTTGPIGSQTWVTADPHLKKFCAGYVAQRGPDPVSLTLRLEQRLGLAPQSAKTHFVEFEIADAGNPGQIFRPCVDTAVTTNTCKYERFPDCDGLEIGEGTDKRPATAEEKAACHKNYAFFTSQYYNSYGVALPTEFPWTSLGYTFDWAHQPIGLGDRPAFVQYGQSEYVVPATAEVTVKSVTPTLEYCTPN